MVTVSDIIELLPDNVLIALTDDQESGAINENLIAKIISDGYSFIQAKAADTAQGVQDEFVRNYVLSRIYAYAGMDEKAQNFQALYNEILRSVSSNEASGGRFTILSNDRIFTDEELEEW